MASKLVLSFQGIGEAMRGPEVRAALATRADAIANRARGLYSADGVTAEVGREDGTNRNGRPFARVTSTASHPEFGTSRTARRRTLGRAAEGG